MASASTPSPLPSVLGVFVHAGAVADPDAPFDLVVEVPHGATRTAHFDAVADRLESPFPDDLRAFFHVNTDVGAPELALDLAARLVAVEPARKVLVLRCLVPRTFVDCNRVIEADARPRASRAGEVTPGLAPYVRSEADRRLLLARHAAYVETVAGAVDAVCGAGGEALFLHTYAPRTVEVDVDDDIVRHLREAYRPERVTTWPLRPPFDAIVRTPEGEMLASATRLARVREAVEGDGFQMAEGETYPLHPATMAHAHARRHPGRTLCLEVRRDLLVPAFTPFEEMRPEPGRVGRIAALLVEAYRTS